MATRIMFGDGKEIGVSESQQRVLDAIRDAKAEPVPIIELTSNRDGQKLSVNAKCIRSFYETQN